jgi:hypothetical protein
MSEAIQHLRDAVRLLGIERTSEGTGNPGSDRFNRLTTAYDAAQDALSEALAVQP